MSNNQFIDKIEAAVRLMGYATFKISDLSQEDILRLEHEIKNASETSIESRIIGAYPGKIIRASEHIDTTPFIANDMKKMKVHMASYIYSAVIFLVFGLLLFKFAWYILPIFGISTITSLILAHQMYKDLKKVQEKSLFSNRLYIDMPLIVRGNVETITHDNGTYELCAVDTDYIVIHKFRAKDYRKCSHFLEIIIEKGLQT